MKGHFDCVKGPVCSALGQRSNVSLHRGLVICDLRDMLGCTPAAVPVVLAALKRLSKGQYRNSENDDDRINRDSAVALDYTVFIEPGLDKVAVHVAGVHKIPA